MKTIDKINRLADLKTVTVYVREWFDRVNGNSYFSGVVIMNDSLENQETISLPFQYGYGTASEYAAMDAIRARFPRVKWDSRPLWQLRDRKIPYSYVKQENCTRKQCQELVA